MSASPPSNPSSQQQAASEPAAQETPETAQQTPAPSQEETLRQELEKFRDLALRAQADLDNFRKRILREKEDAVRFANAAFLERLLPILDSFELGLQAARNSQGAEAIAQGFALVEKLLQDFLRDCGVQPVGAKGEVFDPNLHEAVSHENHDEVEEGRISAVMRRGYKLHERLLRPASVVVSKGPPEASTQQEEAQAATGQHPQAGQAHRKPAGRSHGKLHSQTGQEGNRSSGLSTHA